MGEKIVIASGSDKTLWHTYAKDNTPIGIIDIKLVRWILRNYVIIVIGKMPYIYENGYYRLDENETRLKDIIQLQLLDEVITINNVNRIYNLILASDSLQKEFSDMNIYPKNWINFRNGMFDPIKWEMHEHNEKYLATNQVPHAFIPNAPLTGSTTKEFIEFSIPNEQDREMLWQYYGYCMTIDSSLQKFLTLKGQGGTGKSQLIHIADVMVGRENLSNISLQQLNERFYPSMLLGKLLNTCADIPSKAMEAVDGIKKATGEDYLFAERKGKDGFSFRSYAKLLFSANEIPLNIEEKSEALYRRMMIIKVERKPAKKDPKLQEKLDSEINYSIMQAMEALHRMYINGGIIESQNSKDNVQELYMEADSVTAFLYEHSKVVEGKSVKSAELYEQYDKYCQEGDRRAVGRTSFHKTMKNKGFIKKRKDGAERYFDLVLTDSNIDEDGFVTVDTYIQEDLPFT